MDAQTLRFEGDIGGRARGIDKGVGSHTGPGGADRTIAEPFAGRYPGAEALLAKPAAAAKLRNSAVASPSGLANPSQTIAAMSRCAVPT